MPEESDLEKAVREVLEEKLAAHSLYHIEDVGTAFRVCCWCGWTHFDYKNEPRRAWAIHAAEQLKA